MMIVVLVMAKMVMIMRITLMRGRRIAIVVMIVAEDRSEVTHLKNTDSKCHCHGVADFQSCQLQEVLASVRGLGVSLVVGVQYGRVLVAQDVRDVVPGIQVTYSALQFSLLPGNVTFVDH